jgi:hypothetical protein
MSFRLFIYYCAVCGAWAALLGWVVNRPVPALLPDKEVAQAIVQGVILGVMVAFGLSLVDALWNGSFGQAGKLLARIGVAVAVGFVGCVIGAAVGQLLTNATDNEYLQLFGLVVGWTLTGLLIGASLGVFDMASGVLGGAGARGAIRKIINGIVGGALGGLLGGILKEVLGVVFGWIFHKPPADLQSSSAVGYVTLGACIGLFIGLAQVILKEAWLRVEAGFRPGREMLLSKAETTLGRAETCDLGLYGDNGIERTHARIVHEGSRYLLADAGTPGGTFLNEQPVTQPTALRSGDAIRVGKSIVRFGERQKRTSK